MCVLAASKWLRGAYPADSYGALLRSVASTLLPTQTDTATYRATASVGCCPVLLRVRVTLALTSTPAERRRLRPRLLVFVRSGRPRHRAQTLANRAKRSRSQRRSSDGSGATVSDGDAHPAMPRVRIRLRSDGEGPGSGRPQALGSRRTLSRRQSHASLRTTRRPFRPGAPRVA